MNADTHRLSRAWKVIGLAFCASGGVDLFQDFVRFLGGESGIDEITGLEIPTGAPIVYELDDELAAVDRYYLKDR